MRTLCATLLLLIPMACQAAEPETAWDRLQAGQFVVFAEVIGVGDKDIAADGVEPITYLYGRFFRPGPSGQPVDLEYLAAECAKLEVPNNMVGIDLEDERVRGLICWADEADWEPAAQIADNVIATIRKAQPDWKLGWFGHIASIEERAINGFHAFRGPGSQGARHDEYLSAVGHQQFMGQRLGKALDWYHPALYLGNWHWEYAHPGNPLGMAWSFEVAKTADGDRIPSPILTAQQSGQDVWRDVTHVGLRLMEQSFPRKPIIPAISPQWWTLKAGQQDLSKPGNGQFVRDEWIVQQLDLLRAEGCAGVVIWVAPKQDGWEPEAFMRSRRWKLICDWANNARRDAEAQSN